jgi:hypothetical protein
MRMGCGGAGVSDAQFKDGQLRRIAHFWFKNRVRNCGVPYRPLRNCAACANRNWPLRAIAQEAPGAKGNGPLWAPVGHCAANLHTYSHGEEVKNFVGKCTHKVGDLS